MHPIRLIPRLLMTLSLAVTGEMVVVDGGFTL